MIRLGKVYKYIPDESMEDPGYLYSNNDEEISGLYVTIISKYNSYYIGKFKPNKFISSDKRIYFTESVLHPINTLSNIKNRPAL